LLSESDSSRQVELQVPSSRFLSPGQYTIHDPEECSQSIFSSAMSSRRHLNNECIDRSIRTNHGDPSEAVAMSSTDLDRRRESSDLGEIIPLVNMLQVLPGYVYFVELGMVEFVQVAAMLVERLCLAAAIQTSFIYIAPVL
jgi:hypothetical protein